MDAYPDADSPAEKRIYDGAQKAAAILLAMGKPPVTAVYTFLVAPLVQAGGLSALAVKAAPLIMMGAGLALCYRASVWNIGCEGQFTVGAICAGGVALALPGLPAPILYPAVIVAGCGQLMTEVALFTVMETEATTVL